MRQLFEGVTGLTDVLLAEATRWVRVVLYILLLLFLVGVGFQTQYLERGKTFGSSPFPDYLALLAWGLSADVVSRNISNLLGKK